MDKDYITFMQSEIELLLNETYSTPRERARALMTFIIKHERKEIELVEILVRLLVHRKESDVVQSAVLRTTFRYHHLIPSWGRLLYETDHEKLSMFNGLFNQTTWVNYLRSRYA